MDYSNDEFSKSIVGCILGTAVGDAIGLPAEGLSRRKLARMYPKLDGHHLFFGCGMVSDDTEHTVMVAQALMESVGNADLFARSFARKLKSWLLSVPPGTGKATAGAICKLLIGIPPAKSGVFSAGNGPAMRSAIFGVCYGQDRDKMRELVRVSTRITHADPKAEFGALAVALAAHMSACGVLNPQAYLNELRNMLPDDAAELCELIAKAVESVECGESPADFATSIGWERGVSAYIYATVPVVIHAVLRYQDDYHRAIIEVVKCGGDTDTTAAIVGAIIGSSVGEAGIPRDWLNGLKEWPRSVNWMRTLGNRLASALKEQAPQPPMNAAFPGILARNSLFLAIVLLHGFRRLFIW